MDKGHGRIETRSLWCLPIDPSTIGLAGAAQLMRVERDVLTVRQGQVVKETHEVAFPCTTLWPDETNPAELQTLTRSHWNVENRQFHRRDRTQDEDRCTVDETRTARHLSLFRSLAIFLLEANCPRQDPKQSLPDFERQVCQKP